MQPPAIDARIELVCPRFPNARFLARVREVRSELLVLTLPMVAGEPMKLEPGERLSLRWTEEELVIAAFRGTEKGGLLAKVEILETLTRQRRGFFRWAVPLPVRFTVRSEDGRSPAQIAHTLDISGGGLCVPWNEPLEVGREIEIDLALDREPMHASARVVESRPNPDGPAAYHLALEFVRISEADRSRIVRFIFRKQWASRSR